MPKPYIDNLKVKEMADNGLKAPEIARKIGCHRSAIYKIMKKMNLETTKAAVVRGEKYEAKKSAATEHLLYLADKARKEIEWIENTVPPQNDDEYRAWQQQKLKFSSEIRKLINAMADIGYKMFQVSEVNAVIGIILEEISNESDECAKRIRDRIQHRRDIRFLNIGN